MRTSLRKPAWGTSYRLQFVCFSSSCRMRSSFRASNMTPVHRTYEDAIKVIDGRQRSVRPSKSSTHAVAKEPSHAQSGTPDLRGTPGIAGMSEWLRMLGHDDEAINALNIIHIAGTKGKGSTCAFTESFLRAHGQRTGFPSKTGMYTSPHLLLPEERIRIDSLTLSQTLFAKYFFEVYDRLPQLATDYDPDTAVVERGPRHLQLYALLAFHVFIREKVDVAIIETHCGGEYDATNVVAKPIVTAITSLGMDHVRMLGPSIENIAWHKAGIYKADAVALSTLQDPGPARVLADRARKVKTDVVFVDEDAHLPQKSMQLRPAIQKKNASLALAAANALLARKSPTDSLRLTEKDIERGVEQWHWPGRFETIPDGNRTWYLDAAHNDMSVRIAAQWFAENVIESKEAAARILIFTHINESRDALSVLESLADGLKQSGVRFEHAIFTTYTAVEGGDDAQRSSNTDHAAFCRVWQRFFPKSRVWDEASIRGAVDRARSLTETPGQDFTQILVTGSQHLVGPALRILGQG